MDKPPFIADNELYRKLSIILDPYSIRRQLKHVPSEPHIDRTNQEQYLPGQPQVLLQDHNLGSYLESELVPRDLNRLAPHMWLIAKQDSAHISSLTHQNVRGRNIIITENPGLHLVWIHDRVFIKPLPKYLLSHAFWKFYLEGQSPIPEHLRQEIRRAALGFLRSYFYLVQHKSDFILATDDKHRLLPKNTSYSKFIRFIAAFEHITDHDVSPRYKFGELRLTRLNFWSKLLLQRLNYHKVHGQHGAYFASFYGPILFIFGGFSVSLSAMQVLLAIQPAFQIGRSWEAFGQMAYGFSIFTLVSVALVTGLLLCLFFILPLREIGYALKDLYRRRQTNTR
jgi:hypothetical protein